MYLQLHTSPASAVNHTCIVPKEKHCLCATFPLSFGMLPSLFIVPISRHTTKLNKKIRFLQRLKSFTELFTTFRFQWINQRFDKTQRMMPSIKRRCVEKNESEHKDFNKAIQLNAARRKNSMDLISALLHAHHEELFFSKTFYQMHY